VEGSAPGVVSVVPGDGQAGVRFDAELVLTFDEPMDRESVQNATSIAGFDTSPLEFSWNGDSTQVTIVPERGYKYKSGTDPNVEAYTYVLTVGTEAHDQAGNGLAAPFTSDFRTKRNITQTFNAQVATMGSFTNPAPSPCGSGARGSVGWMTTDQRFVFALFSVWSLPEPDELTIISAKFAATQAAPIGDFYANQAGNVQLREVANIDITSSELDDSTVVADLGLFAFNTAPALEKDVTSAFNADFKLDFRSMMYRLSYGGTPPQDAMAQFECGSIRLIVAYETE